MLSTDTKGDLKKSAMRYSFFVEISKIGFQELQMSLQKVGSNSGKLHKCVLHV